MRDVVAGTVLASLPLAVCAFFLIATRIFILKTVMPWSSLVGVLGAAIAVPLIEELFFRGLLLGILLRGLRPILATLLTSAFFAVIHFLKAPDATNDVVTWFSGFRSIANSFAQFADPMMVLALFATLFLIGWILADARLRTRSLFLPIGLHSGWILVAGVVGKLTRRGTIYVALVGSELAHRLAAACFGIDYLGVDDCLAALCETIAHLSRYERSRPFFTRRCVPFAMDRLRGASTFARIALIKHNALSLPFVQNVQSHFQERSTASSPARTV